MLFGSLRGAQKFAPQNLIVFANDAVVGVIYACLFNGRFHGKETWMLSHP